MKKAKNPIKFTCPGCKEPFEFDAVGAYELVPCPICGTDFMTIKKGHRLQLEAFTVNPQIETTVFLTAQI